MENNLIKVFDSNKAQELADLGFRYTLDRINNQTVYAFFVSKELTDYLNSNFDSKDYFMNNTLHFQCEKGGKNGFKKRKDFTII